MIISELYVSWFPLLFGLFFIVSFLIDEVRKRGHLRLGRDPKKGEIIGILVLLGFNLVVAIPVVLIGIIIEYTIGTPPVLELLMIAVMSLSELIPIFLSGIISYFIIKGIYDSWGVSIAVFCVTLIIALLVLLDSIGWLQPALPFIIDMVSTFVVAQVEIVLIWVGFAICLGKCTASSREREENVQDGKKKLSGLSVEKSLILLVGLGRRIVKDTDEDAHEALKSIYESHQQCSKALSVVGKDVNIDLGNIIAKNDIIYSQEAMGFVNRRFGKLKKWVRNVLMLFLIVTIISAVLAIISLVVRFYFGFFLFMPTITLPIIGGFGYQQLARFEEGRYVPPMVTQFNSYLLTSGEFRKRVVRERIVFGLSLLGLCYIIGASLLGIPASSLVWMTIAATAIFIAAILSTRDRFLTSERLEPPIMVERGLKFIGVKDVEELAEDSDILKQPLEYEERVRPTPEISLDWQQQLEVRGHGDFAKKVVDKSREAYSEQSSTLIFLGCGATTTFIGVMTYAMFRTFTFMGSIQYLSVAFIIIGIPPFMYGAYEYLRTRNLTRFNKLNRKNLTLLLSYFDQKAQGVSDFGTMTDIHAPSEYLNYGIVTLFMNTFIRAAIARLQYRVPWPKEVVERVWKTRSSYPKLETIGLLVSSSIFVIVYQWFASFQSSYFPDFMKLVFLGLIAFMILTVVWAFIFYYIEKRALVEVNELMRGVENVTYLETLAALINLISSEFPMPLRVLFVGNYPEIAYTGRVLYTTTGIELREAVIIPQGMVSDVS